MSWPIYKTVLGLRYIRNFSFSGISGTIVDKIIKDKTYFTKPEHEFKEISWTNDRMGMKLKNKLGNCFLDCSFDGYVLTYHFTEDDETTLDEIKNMYKKLIKIAITNTDMKNEINRIGIINYYTFQKDDNTAKHLFDTILKFDLSGLPDQFGLRFALKNVTENSLVDTTQNDYSNVIYQITSDKIDKEESKIPELIDMNIDYQIYFSPERKYETKLIDKHFDDMNKYLEKVYKKNIIGVADE